MVTRFRNSSYYGRLFSRIAIGAVGLGVIALVMAFVALPTSETNAANLEFSPTGWNNLGPATVQFIGSREITPDNFTTNSSNFDIVRNKTYSKDDVQSGLLISERNGRLTYGGAGGADTTGESFYAVVFRDNDNEIIPNERARSSGTATIRYSNQVVDAAGNKYDLLVILSNVVVENRSNFTLKKPIAIYNQGLCSWVALQEHTSQESLLNTVDPNGAYLPPVITQGVSVDVQMKVVQHGTELSVTGKYLPLGWMDLDVPDMNPDSSATYEGPYTEAITLTGGVYGKVYGESNHILNVRDTSEYGRNTNYRATAYDEGTKRSGMTYLVESGSSTFTWKGRNCGTDLGMLPTNKVTTEVYGTYPNGATITATDNNVLWKEDKTITMQAKSGYYIKQVKVDGAIVYNGTDQSVTSRTETFDDVTANHSVSVSVDRRDGDLTIHHYLVGTTTKLADDDHRTGKMGDAVSCQAKTFEKYEVSTAPSASSCVIGATGTEIAYYYIKKKGKLYVSYVDVDTNDAIKGDNNQPIKDTYTDFVDVEAGIQARDIEHYELITRPKTMQITYTVADQNLVFYYRRICHITIHYVDFDDPTNQIAEDTIETGMRGDAYKAKPIKIEHYKLYQSPESEDLTYGYPDQEITYYYRRRASITIRYVDKDTDREIEKSTYLEDGYDGDKGSCKNIEVPGYEIVGKLNDDDCVYSNDGTELTIYYRKKPSKNPNTNDEHDPILGLSVVAALGVIAGLGVVKFAKRR